jgi:hypothetical protein
MRREIVPEGPMKVAQYEVLGSDAKEMSVPPGMIEPFASGSLACGSTSVSAHRSSRPGRVAFSKKQPSTSYWATFIGSCGTDFLRPNGPVRLPAR